MTKKTRLALLLVCIFSFLIITPYIVFYALGYRVNFETGQINVIGGIYIRVLPTGSDIYVDSIKRNPTGLFSSAVFVQNLLPVEHTVSVKKDGYFDYQKTLIVKEKEVAKLENILLFKRNNAFSLLNSTTDYFSTAPDNNTLLSAKIDYTKVTFEITNLRSSEKKTVSLPFTNPAISETTWNDNSTKALVRIRGMYYLLDTTLTTPTITSLPLLTGATSASFNPRNDQELFFIKENNLYLTGETNPLAKSIVAYRATNNDITWLSYDGYLYSLDLANNVTIKINSQLFPVRVGANFKIMNIAGVTFIQRNNALFWINPNQPSESKEIESFHENIKVVKVSPNGQEMMYINDNEILYTIFNDGPIEQISFHKSTGKITDLHWINDDYVTFAEDNKITIAETDIRGNVNMITLPQTVTVDTQKVVDIKTPKIFYNRQSNKLYIQTQRSLIVSEKLTPQ